MRPLLLVLAVYTIHRIIAENTIREAAAPVLLLPPPRRTTARRRSPGT
ncbi:hypothetical protein C7441_11366 [Pseudaminobacter salicylatoxidans]|uniref:Uncharacterized protein n=1 Tax=Pseudaminobacter salicylatoxidans TaxID=93369 RepID=A0A316BZ48_PSESE|nr:hypothetical protein C7441_11366 [Pseudaminobacter salicylatoxidans]